LNPSVNTFSPQVDEWPRRMEAFDFPDGNAGQRRRLIEQRRFKHAHRTDAVVADDGPRVSNFETVLYRPVPQVENKSVKIKTVAVPRRALFAIARWHGDGKSRKRHAVFENFFRRFGRADAAVDDVSGFVDERRPDVFGGVAALLGQQCIVEKNQRATAAPNAANLIDTIVETIDQSTWQKHNGNGTIQLFDNGDVRVLVVSQNQDTQERIAALLKELRSFKELKTAKTSTQEIASAQKK
jgi:hypothetical protein